MNLSDAELSELSALYAAGVKLDDAAAKVQRGRWTIAKHFMGLGKPDWYREMKRASYRAGRDYCSRNGAEALAAKIRDAHRREGREVRLEIYRSAVLKHRVIWGIRRATAPKVNAPKVETFDADAQLTQFVTAILTQFYPGIALAQIRSKSLSPRVLSARKYCIRRAHAAKLTSIYGLAKFFNRHHSSVMQVIGRKMRRELARKAMSAAPQFADAAE